MIVEKANEHIAIAVNIDTPLPYVFINPPIVSSAPEGERKEYSLPSKVLPKL